MNGKQVREGGARNKVPHSKAQCSKAGELFLTHNFLAARLCKTIVKCTFFQ